MNTHHQVTGTDPYSFYVDVQDDHASNIMYDSNETCVCSVIPVFYLFFPRQSSYCFLTLLGLNERSCLQVAQKGRLDGDQKKSVDPQGDPLKDLTPRKEQIKMQPPLFSRIANN